MANTKEVVDQFENQKNRTNNHGHMNEDNNLYEKV